MTAKTQSTYKEFLRCSRPLNGHELACLEDREYMRIHAEILTGYKLSDKELDEMINKIKQQKPKNFGHQFPRFKKVEK